MRVFTYHTSGGKDLILEYLDSLPKDESALGYAIIKRFSKQGFDALEGLTTRQIKGKLWEIKFRTKNRIFTLWWNREAFICFTLAKNRKEKQSYSRLKRLKKE
jgi:hypothetical protein